MNVSIWVESNDDKVYMWIEGNKIKGIYLGENPKKEYDFTLTNKFLDATEYAFITVEDFTKTGGD